MSIRIPKSTPQVQIEPGTYLARCYSMIHIGTNTFSFNGEEKQSNRVRIGFELPTELKVFKENEEARPLVISQEYTLSLHDKSKLKPLLESWRGKKFTDEEADEFEISKLVGVPAFISVIHNEKGYAEIASISKPPKGTECPAQVNPSQILDFNENWNEALFEKLPTFIKSKIMTSKEYRAMKGETVDTSVDYSANTDSSSDVPF